MQVLENCTALLKRMLRSLTQFAITAHSLEPLSARAAAVPMLSVKWSCDRTVASPLELHFSNVCLESPLEVRCTSRKFAWKSDSAWV